MQTGLPMEYESVSFANGGRAVVIPIWRTSWGNGNDGGSTNMKRTVRTVSNDIHVITVSLTGYLHSKTSLRQHMVAMSGP